MKNSTFLVAGLITFAEPIVPTSERVQLPTRWVESHELVYRMGRTFEHFLAGDLLVVDPKQEPQTGQSVLATFENEAYIGMWWAKHKKNELVVDFAIKPMRGVTVVGVINLIVRLS